VRNRERKSASESKGENVRERKSKLERGAGGEYSICYKSFRVI